MAKYGKIVINHFYKSLKINAIFCQVINNQSDRDSKSDDTKIHCNHLNINNFIELLLFFSWTLMNMKIFFSPEFQGPVFLGLNEEKTPLMDVMVCDTMSLIGILEFRHRYPRGRTTWSQPHHQVL